MSRPIFESTNHPLRRNRQRIRKIPLKSTISEGFWSEWGDSNARSLEPKSSAIPTSLHPDIQFLPLYHGREENQRFFCLWSFLWSKLLLCRFRQPGKTRYCLYRKALRRFALPRPGYNHGTPKPGAIPALLYPDIQLLPL